ncbi:hypothetical protein HaLaN_11234 [Haematococcus lacustris]|uniref:Uncharacterized protein n=1 Tax=Haematococcus lacustris TaxID=44745 RepID=A0A699YXS3_HAELA|nr:hypothetical protein HaLaN_11234 [Haematococcus lacustris]
MSDAGMLGVLTDVFSTATPLSPQSPPDGERLAALCLDGDPTYDVSVMGQAFPTWGWPLGEDVTKHESECGSAISL